MCITPLSYQKWTARETIAQFLRMSLSARFSPSFVVLGNPLERIQKLALVGSAITRNELLPGTTGGPCHSTLSDFGAGASTTTDLLWVPLRCGLWPSCGCDVPWDSLIRFAGSVRLLRCAWRESLVWRTTESGPILSWSQSLVLVRFCCRPGSRLFLWQLRESVARWYLISIWKGTGFVKSSPGCSPSSNGERVAPFFIPGISLPWFYMLTELLTALQVPVEPTSPPQSLKRHAAEMIGRENDQLAEDVCQLVEYRTALCKCATLKLDTIITHSIYLPISCLDSRPCC